MESLKANDEKAKLKHWAKIAMICSVLTILFNTVEGLISIFYGAEKEQLSLFGFGLGSCLEVISACIVYYQLKYKEKIQEGTA